MRGVREMNGGEREMNSARAGSGLLPRENRQLTDDEGAAAANALRPDGPGVEGAATRAARAMAKGFMA